METLGVRRHLITKMSYIYCIMPFYGYAYESVKVLKSLCHKTRNLWISQQDAIIRMFKKQTIDLEFQPIDDKTIEVLKKSEKYKLFKLSVFIDIPDQERLRMIYRLLDEMPEFEISKIKTFRGSNDLINTLAKKPMFKSKQELFEKLDFKDYQFNQQSGPYEYISDMYNPYKHDMS